MRLQKDLKNRKIRVLFHCVSKLRASSFFVDGLADMPMVILASSTGRSFSRRRVDRCSDHRADGEIIRSLKERGVSGSFGKVVWDPKKAPVYNPAFDIRPIFVVTSYILDMGSLTLEEFLER